MDFYDVVGCLTLGLWDKPKQEETVEKVSTSQEDYIQQPLRPIKFSYRPQTFSEYISQDKAKDKIKLTIEIIKTFAPRHFLLMGNAGYGKTTMANIIANTLGFKFNAYVGSSFDIVTMKDFILKNQVTNDINILFIDEIAEIDKKTLTFMLPIIEDFKSENQNLRKFILIGATTDSWLISKRCQPFLDRIHCKVNLEDYVAEDIRKILVQYNDQVYKQNISLETYNILSHNVRFSPRQALSFFDFLIATKGDIDRVLKMNRIIKDGLDDVDVRILQHLSDCGGRAVGEEALSIVANMSRQEYKQLREPYILRQGLISRTARGRICTEKGKQILQEIK